MNASLPFYSPMRSTLSAVPWTSVPPGTQTAPSPMALICHRCTVFLNLSPSPLVTGKFLVCYGTQSYSVQSYHGSGRSIWRWPQRPHCSPQLCCHCHSLQQWFSAPSSQWTSGFSLFWGLLLTAHFDFPYSECTGAFFHMCKIDLNVLSLLGVQSI